MTLSDWLAEERVVDRLIVAGMRKNCACAGRTMFCPSGDGGSRAAALSPMIRFLDSGSPDELKSWESTRTTAVAKVCWPPLSAASACWRHRRMPPAANDRLPSKRELRDSTRRALQPRLGHWSNYPQTVARRLTRNFPHVSQGANIAFASNLPASSGMSSSSAHHRYVFGDCPFQ